VVVFESISESLNVSVMKRDMVNGTGQYHQTQLDRTPQVTGVALNLGVGIEHV
jgi:hypothetical protein